MSADLQHASGKAAQHTKHYCVLCGHETHYYESVGKKRVELLNNIISSERICLRSSAGARAGDSKLHASDRVCVDHVVAKRGRAKAYQLEGVNRGIVDLHTFEAAMATQPARARASADPLRKAGVRLREATAEQRRAANALCSARHHGNAAKVRLQRAEADVRREHVDVQRRLAHEHQRRADATAAAAAAAGAAAAVAADNDHGDDVAACECAGRAAREFDTAAAAAAALCFEHWAPQHACGWHAATPPLTHNTLEPHVRMFTRCRSLPDLHRVVYDTLRSAHAFGDVPQERSTCAVLPCTSVLAVLLRCTSALQYEFIAVLLGVERTTLQHAVHRWRPLVARVCRQYLTLSVDAALSNSHVQIVRDLGPNVLVAVDCTYCATHQAYACAVRRTQHCDNKMCTLNKVMLFCYPNGVPALHVTPLPGGGDDARMFEQLLTKHEALRDFVKAFRTYLEHTYTGSGLMPAFLVDRGFAHVKLAAESCKRLEYDANDQCAYQLASPTFLQCSADGKFSSIDEVHNNRTLAVHRSVVEQVNARLRSFRLLYFPLGLYEALHLRDWLDIACGIIATNYKPFRRTATRDDIEAAGAEFVAALKARSAADALHDATQCSSGVMGTVALANANSTLFMRDAGRLACWARAADAAVGANAPLFQQTRREAANIVPSYSGNLVLDAPSHRYTLNGVQVQSSVTGCLTEFFEFDESAMAARCARSNIDVYRGLTKAGVLKVWEEWRQRGTRVHCALERYANAFGTSERGQQIDTSASDPLLHNDAECAAYDAGKAYLSHLHDNGWKVAFAELLVFAEKWDLAGAIDVVLHKRTDAGTFELLTVDWKVPGRRDVVQQLAQPAPPSGGGSGAASAAPAGAAVATSAAATAATARTAAVATTVARRRIDVVCVRQPDRW